MVVKAAAKAVQQAAMATIGGSEERIWVKGTASFTSTLFAQTAVYPFDVVRRRAQHRAKLMSVNTWQVAKEAAKEGALFRAVSMNLFKTPLNSALAWVIFQTLLKATAEQ